MNEAVKTRYWMGVVSQSHVQRGVNGGFAQLCHGKEAPLRKMNQGDWLVYYSPKTDMNEGQALKQFTAIGKVVGKEVYQFEMSPDFVPYRRDISYIKAEPASIIPLLGILSFAKDPKNWGFPLRRGHLELTADDFRQIAASMGAQIDEQGRDE